MSKTKIIVTVSLIIFAVALIGILAGAVIFQKQPTVNPITPVNTSKITLAVMAGHNSQSDCWLSVRGKVYNITDYISFHPAGPEKIIPFCGKDATQAFDTKGGNGSHSAQASETLSQFYVGELAN